MDDLYEKPAFWYANRLTTAHRHVNRVRSWIENVNITDQRKEILIAIQYLKDVDELLIKAESILYNNQF